MEHLYGKMVRAHLKGSHETICGVLVEHENDHIYIQAAVDNVYVIPQNNILYYQTSSIAFRQQESAEENDNKMIQAGNITTLSVYVDKEIIATIPVPPSLNLAVYNDNIYRTAYGNPDVKSVLSGKVQKSIEYYPGQLFITTEFVAQQQQQQQRTQDSSFSMNSVGSAATSFLNPVDMVSRLQNITKGEKDDKQTKM